MNCSWIKTSIFFLGTVFLLNPAKAQERVEQWSRFELVFEYPNPEESFTKVSLSARFYNQDTSFVVNGFYDGGDRFLVRFMPVSTGNWNYLTSSNISALNKKKGSFECFDPGEGNHGLVKVSNTWSFSYADGKQFYPFGTTAYAWTHMGNELQEITLNSLTQSGFNKLRMCVFPKNYNLVKEEPELYPFKLNETKLDEQGNKVYDWDFEYFNPAFFQHLEKRIDDLGKLGIEADLILFHPYDKGRWGFDEMPNELNVRYLQYLAARLSSFRNVWWSLANEYDYVKSKGPADWELLIKTITAADPYKHLCSIHGSTGTYYEYWKPELTHSSIQDNVMLEDFGRAAVLRNVYKKPIVYDEVNYEGNLKQRWGRLSGEEMNEAFWQAAITGTYATHGETYWQGNDTDTIFWAKGGALKGTSWKRIAFLRQLMEQGPGAWCLADLSRDNQTSTAGDSYYMVYFGRQMNSSWLFNLPAKNAQYEKPKPGTRYKVEIIDTWDMTIQSCPEIFTCSAVNDYRLYDKDFKKVQLPMKPYLALRITKID